MNAAVQNDPATVFFAAIVRSNIWHVLMLIVLGIMLTVYRQVDPVFSQIEHIPQDDNYLASAAFVLGYPAIQLILNALVLNRRRWAVYAKIVVLCAISIRLGIVSLREPGWLLFLIPISLAARQYWNFVYRNQQRFLAVTR